MSKDTLKPKFYVKHSEGTWITIGGREHSWKGGGTRNERGTF